MEKYSTMSSQNDLCTLTEFNLEPHRKTTYADFLTRPQMGVHMYSPHTHKLVNDFYEPVLLNTVRYDRVAGYFRSSVLATVSCGYEGFCDHPGSKMRLIVGLEMTQDDH